ncbi:MAG: ankyrin repeat domain-containing protein [Alphaproteobacteria bacterium]
MTFFTEDLRRKSPEELGSLLMHELTQAPAQVDETLAVKFVRAGAKPDTRNLSDQTPLMLAAQGGLERVARALIETGANTEDRDTGQCTATHWAALNGHKGIFDALIESGAEIKVKDYKQDTPLLFAAFNGHTAIVAALLELGCDIDEAGSRGTLEETARAEHHEETALFIENIRAERKRAIEEAERERDALADWQDKGLPLQENISVPAPLRLKGKKGAYSLSS